MPPPGGAPLKPDVTITVHFRWWLMPYLRLLAMACQVSGREPDWNLLARIVERGTVVR